MNCDADVRFEAECDEESKAATGVDSGRSLDLVDAILDITGLFYIWNRENEAEKCPRLLSILVLSAIYCYGRIMYVAYNTSITWRTILFRPPEKQESVAAISHNQRPLHSLQLLRVHRRHVLRCHHLPGEKCILLALRFCSDACWWLWCQEASGDALNAYYANICVGLTQIVGSVIGAFAVSAVGRRPLLAASRNSNSLNRILLHFFCLFCFKYFSGELKSTI